MALRIPTREDDDAPRDAGCPEAGASGAGTARRSSRVWPPRNADSHAAAIAEGDTQSWQPIRSHRQWPHRPAGDEGTTAGASVDATAKADSHAAHAPSDGDGQSWQPIRSHRKWPARPADDDVEA